MDSKNIVGLFLVIGYQLMELRFVYSRIQNSKLILIFCLSFLNLQIKSNYGIVLDKLTAGSIVGLLLSETGRLFLYVDGVNLGPLPAGLPTSHNYHAVFDLYGQCEQVRKFKLLTNFSLKLWGVEIRKIISVYIFSHRKAPNKDGFAIAKV